MDFLIEAIENKTYSRFVERFSEYAVLLVDLFEDIGGKGATTDEFLHLFRALLKQGVSIAVSICIRANKPTDAELYRIVSNSSLSECQHAVCLGIEKAKIMEM